METLREAEFHLREARSGWAKGGFKGANVFSFLFFAGFSPNGIRHFAKCRNDIIVDVMEAESVVGLGCERENQCGGSAQEL